MCHVPPEPDAVADVPPRRVHDVALGTSVVDRLFVTTDADLRVTVANRLRDEGPRRPAPPDVLLVVPHPLTLRTVISELRRGLLEHTVRAAVLRLPLPLRPLPVLLALLAA